MINSRVRSVGRRRIFFLLVGLVLLPCPLFGQSPLSDEPAVLNPGDLVRVQVWRQPEFSGEYEVTGAGTIAHPLYREIRVTGREVMAVEDELRTFLRQYVEEPSFVVEGFFRIAVGGEVRQPDVYTLRPETSVARAVALAGGPTDRGSLEEVILRRGPQEYTLNLADPELQIGELEVRSGDAIVVERQSAIFRDYIVPAATIVGAVAAVLRLSN